VKFKFQAKDIQHILRITKIRYEYLTSKLGIKPDVEEVEGTGRAHLYSFKNVLQIAVAHNANKMGMSLRIVKSLLDDLESYKDEVEPELFDAVKNTRVSIYCAYHGEFPIVYIKGKDFRFYTDVAGKIRELEVESKLLKEEDYQDFKEHQDYYIAVLTDIASVIEDFPPDPKWLKRWLEISDGYITINFGTIKTKIISHLEE